MNNKYSHLNIRKIGDIGKNAFRILLLLLLSQSVFGQQSQLTPIGSTLANITNSDDANQNVSITGVFSGGIQFGANTYTSMYVSSNGYVTFGHGNSGYSPLGIAGYTLGPIIAAQYDDLHPGIAGDIYYSQNTDYVVVTYLGVAPYRSPTGVGSGYNTFQIVLRKAAGYNGSSNLNFTIEIRYISMNWAKSGNNSAWPTAGWSTGTGLVYSVLPYSGTSSFLSNASSSNVGSAGLYNFGVEGGVVQSPPTVISTSAVSSITGSSGTSGGNVSADGGQTVTARGLAYATSQIPTISNSTVTSGSGTGTFTATMTGLNPGTTYYVRSYATNSLGTGYGPQVSFTTSSVSPPTVTTTAILSITINSATSGYTVTSTGGATVTAQGIVWNTSGTPTTSSNTGTSSGSLTGLSNNTTYYVRAYATNSAGTSYGSQLSFLTLPTDPTTPAASPSTICNGAGSQLSVSNGQGTVTWYTGSCGGTYVGVGNPLTVYPTVNTTYYAKNINTTGASVGCVSVSVIVNQPASAPTGAMASAAGTGSAALSWTGSTGLAPITYSWAVGTTSGVTYESSYTSRGTTTDPTLTATATGLTQSTTYYMVVKAANSCATSVYNTSSSFRTHSVLTYIAGTNGTISGALLQTVANTTSGTAVTVVPNTGYNFVNWSDGSVVNPRTDANVTNSITVTANFAPNRLVFGTEPVNKIAGINIPVTVRVTDTYGNTMASSSTAVTIAINDNPSIGGAGTLAGTLTVNAVNGVVVFNDLWINKTGTGYTLIASAASPITTVPVSNTFNIMPSAIDHLTVEGITDPVVAGTTTSPLVTAYDQYLNIKTDYTGTITFTSTDPQAVLPVSFTYAGGNNGVNTFSNGVTLKSTGEHSVTVTGNSKTGNQSTITVTPAAINHFTLVANGTIVAGVPFTVTATVYDEYGNVKTNYSGSNNVLWTTTSATSGNGTARIIPANGIQTFTAGSATISGFTLFNSDQLPLPTITITDGPTASPGTTDAITVKNAILDNFKVVAGTTQSGGVPFSVTVSARDIYWNIAKDYVGNIRFKSSNDALVTFPAGLQPFTLSNLGVRTFNTININMIGAYWLRAADAVFAFKSGDQQNILVGPGAFSPLTTYSTLTVDQNNRVAGEYVFVTIIPRDAQNNLLYSCRNISVLLDGVASDYNGFIVVNNVGDGSYTTSLRVTSATAINKISAKLDNIAFDQTRTITVTPGLIDLAHSLITASPATMTTDQFSQITVQLKDAFNNNRFTSDGTVALSASRGVLTSVIDNNDGTYSATLHGNSGAVGIANITGSFSGTGSSSLVNGNFTTTATVTISEGLPALAKTSIDASPATMSTDQTSTVTVQLKDQFGNVVTSSVDAVTLSTTLGVLSDVTDNGNGTYTAILSGNNTGTGTASITGTLTGTVAGFIVDNTTVTITEGMPSLINSSIISNTGSITTDGTSTITLQLKDQFNNMIVNNRGTVSFIASIGSISTAIYSGSGTYTATLGGDIRGSNGTGNSLITGTLNTIAFTQTTSVIISEGLPALSQSSITAFPGSITTDQTSVIIVQLKDQFGNYIIHSRGAVSLSTDLGALTAITDNANGSYNATLSANISGVGTATITGSLTGDVTGAFSDNEMVAITDGLPVLSKIEISASPISITSDQTSTITVQLKDQHGNRINQSRGVISMATNLTGSTIANLIDHNNGSYSATFRLIASGTGTATITGNFAGTGTASSVSGSILDNATVEVTFGAAAKLTIITQPSSSATAGIVFAQQPVVRIEDQFGNLVISDNSTIVTASRAAGTDILKGTLTATASNGIATFAGLFYNKAESLTLEFASTPALATTTSTSILTGHAAVHHFALNSPANFIAGASKAAYIVTRYDLFDNQVTTGVQTIYLFSSSIGVNRKFYNALTGGTVITQVTIVNGTSTADFWYYDEKTGDHTITVSDAAPADGITGITDATDQITINPTLLKDFVVYGVLNPHDLGTTQSVTVMARDTYDNVKTNYVGNLTFSSTDLAAIVPDDYQFLLSDQGIHIFANTVKFSLSGKWWITAIDLAEPEKYGAQPDIIVKYGLTIKAENKSKTYDGSVFSPFTVTYSGFVNGDSETALDGTLVFSGSAVNAINSGTAYVITPGGLTSDNYNIWFVDGELNIDKEVLTITADDKSKEYDDEVFPITDYTVTYSGFIEGEDETNLDGELFLSGTAISAVNVNNYVITPEGLTSDNYQIDFLDGVLKITKKELTITADTKTKVYGEANPPLTFQYSGFVNGEDKTLLTAEPIASTVVNLTTPVGFYPADIILAGGLDENYDLIYVPADITVTKATLTATADNKIRVYGSVNPAFSVGYSGFLNNEDATVLDVLPVTSTDALVTSNPGIYNITILGGADNNYDLTLVNGDLEIDKAPLLIIAEDKTKVYGQANPALTITYAGFVLAEDKNVLDVLPVAETAATVNSDAGNYDIIVSGATDGNYSFIYHLGILSINKADQVITFTEIPAGLRITQEHQLIATASSGLPVSFESSDPNAGSLNGNMLTINKEENLTIAASQNGDHNWNPAAEVTQSIVTLPTFDNISSLFTPNNDGMNDTWYIPELEKFGKLQVTVYNRYGKTVYQSDSYKNDWDGTWNGYPLPSASYYYIMKSSEKGFIKGVVNIVR